MDVERNPGPTSTLANSRHSHLLDPSPTQFRYSNLFNTTKRIQLKLTRYNHHLLNYTFFKENNYIPPSLYPRKPPLHSDNQFNRKWKHISHQAAHKHLKLLIKECKNKINTLNMELSNHMELLRNSYSSERFSLYASKLNSMALSLGSLLKKRRTKKTTPVRRFIQHRANYSAIPPQDTASNDTTSNVTVNLSTMPNVLTQHNLTDNNTTPINITANSNYTSSHITSHASMSYTLARTRKRSRRKSKPAKLPLDHSSVFINLSNSILSPDEIFVLARGLTFCPTPRHINWREISADIYDFARHMQLTEYFFDENNTTNVNKRDNPFHNKSTWNPPTNREQALDTFLDAVKLDLTTCKPKPIRDNLTTSERQVNNIHPTIKFTSSHSPTSVPFLDVNVSLTSDGNINTDDLYMKPTDKHQHLLYSSCHPLHTKKAIPFSLALRLRRICSTDETFKIRTTELTTYLLKRGYKRNFVTKQIQRAADIPRTHTLQPKQIDKPKRIPFITTYNPSLPSIFNITKNTTIYFFLLTAAKMLPYIYLLWLSGAPLTFETC